MNINSIKKLSGNIIALALFYFIFLCSEYMFDNRMAVFTDSNGVVMAQSFILGSSVPGFLSYYFIDRFCDRRSFNKKNNTMHFRCALFDMYDRHISDRKLCRRAAFGNYSVYCAGIFWKSDSCTGGPCGEAS